MLSDRLCDLSLVGLPHALPLVEFLSSVCQQIVLTLQIKPHIGDVKSTSDSSKRTVRRALILVAENTMNKPLTREFTLPAVVCFCLTERIHIIKKFVLNVVKGLP